MTTTPNQIPDRFPALCHKNFTLYLAARVLATLAVQMQPDGPRFHPVRLPDTKTLECLLDRLVQRIVRRLTRDGLLVQDPEQPWLDLEPTDTLDQLNAASIRYRIAVGPSAGGRTLTLKNPALARSDSTPKPFTANQNGFSLNCAVACQPHQRDRLKRLCRYITRPALCLDWLSVSATGQCVYPFKNPFRDGTTHVLFNPLDFIARLATLVPVASRPRPIRKPKNPTADSQQAADDPSTGTGTESPTAPMTWAQRLTATSRSPLQATSADR